MVIFHMRPMQVIGLIETASGFFAEKFFYHLRVSDLSATLKPCQLKCGGQSSTQKQFIVKKDHLLDLISHEQC